MKQGLVYICTITMVAIGLSIALGPTTASAQEKIIKVKYQVTITDPDSKHELYASRMSLVSWGSVAVCQERGKAHIDKSVRRIANWGLRNRAGKGFDRATADN